MNAATLERVPAWIHCKTAPVRVQAGSLITARAPHKTSSVNQTRIQSSANARLARERFLERVKHCVGRRMKHFEIHALRRALSQDIPEVAFEAGNFCRELLRKQSGTSLVCS